MKFNTVYIKTQASNSNSCLS